MRRGIIRMITGVVLIVLQLIGQSAVGKIPSNDIWYNIGFYSPGIIGVLLLIFGCRDYRNKRCSKLILHTNSKKIHTVMKWFGFVLSSLMFADCLLEMILSWPDINFGSILNFVGFLSYCVYSLFYMYRKPSCLFSTSLIFIGVSELFGMFRNLTASVLYLLDSDYFVPYVFTRIIPELAAGGLYIVIASIIYKEKFSAKAVRTLGWIVFVCEILARVVTNIVVQQVYAVNVPGLLFVMLLLMYTSVFKLNTLRDIPSRENNPIRFCRKCGERLIDGSCFCRMCGAESIEGENMDASVENDVLDHTEFRERAAFCRKCGRKLLPENSSKCAFCGTAVEYVETGAPVCEPVIQEEERPQKKRRKMSGEMVALFLCLSVTLAGAVICAVLFFMNPKVTPQDINSINGCPEFFNIEFGMTSDEASRLIELKHKTVNSMGASVIFEGNELTVDSSIIFEEGEVFKLYGMKTTDVYVSFSGDYVSSVEFVFDKEKVPFKKIAKLYSEIYGAATTEETAYARWSGSKTTIHMYEYELISKEQKQVVIVRYAKTDANKGERV